MKKNFFQHFYNLLLSSLRTDHQTIFNFYFAKEYLKELQRFRDIDWKIFIEGFFCNFIFS